MNARLEEFLRLLCVLDGRSIAECMRISGMGYSTLKRYVTTARKLGMRIECSFPDYRYRIVDSGPFDLNRLRQVRWPIECNSGFTSSSQPRPAVRLAA